MLLIAVVDCHDFDHLMFEILLVGLLSGMVKNHPLWGKKITVVAKVKGHFMIMGQSRRSSSHHNNYLLLRMIDGLHGIYKYLVEW